MASQLLTGLSVGDGITDAAEELDLWSSSSPFVVA